MFYENYVLTFLLSFPFRASFHLSFKSSLKPKRSHFFDVADETIGIAGGKSYMFCKRDDTNSDF